MSKWYVCTTDMIYEYEGTIYDKGFYTLGSHYPVLFSEEFVLRNGEVEDSVYREATPDEMAWGVPAFSEMANFIPSLDRSKMRFLNRKSGTIETSRPKGLTFESKDL